MSNREMITFNEPDDYDQSDEESEEEMSEDDEGGKTSECEEKDDKSFFNTMICNIIDDFNEEENDQQITEKRVFKELVSRVSEHYNMAKILNIILFLLNETSEIANTTFFP